VPLLEIAEPEGRLVIRADVPGLTKDQPRSRLRTARRAQGGAGREKGGIYEPGEYWRWCYVDETEV
jgi:hypothetical protein